ncbi:MAG: DapH/DapD/GlmU-related protein [Eubacteriales bacterium]|nr:DapH/DapD/GlmU-related protein [Eubacteriales bacterium]
MEQQSWRIAELPKVNNRFNNLIVKMNRYGNLPFNGMADLYRRKAISMLTSMQHVRFDYGFYCLFGNLKGIRDGCGGVWFTNTYILDYAPVYFGNHITIGPDVKLITSWHETSNFNIVNAKPIVIEDNVWITMNAIIMPGVTIGENSIVAAGSVVTKDVPPNSLVAGNPAVVKHQIERLYPYWTDLQRDVVYGGGVKTYSKKIMRIPIRIINAIIYRLI